MTFTEELKLKTQIADTWVKKLAPSGDDIHKEVFEAANYSINAGGKRIRPVIALAVCEMLGGREEDVMPFACAVEYIHTYSLIHDDLPCMDNDDLRRGVPTCHVKYGEALALLAGDTLLNHAFETIANANAPGETIAKALKILSALSGANGMIGGQVIDIRGAKSHEELLILHKKKTGALIVAAAKLGALASGRPNDEDFLAAEGFAKNLGLAFQIKDDILDIEGDVATLGKNINRDSETGKVTFVTLFGIDGAKAALDEYTGKAKAALYRFGDRGNFLSQLAESLALRNR